MKKIVFAGSSIDEYCLEASYKRAFEKLGFEVHWFDTVNTQQKFISYGRLGRYVHDFIGINSWRKKMQREFVLYTKSLDPDLILIFCNAGIHFGGLAFLKSVLRAKIVLVWPDPLLNMEAHLAIAAPLYDGVASYRRQEQSVLESLGFKNISWIPFAADAYLHEQAKIPDKFIYDISFIGNPRPERIRNLESIVRQFPNLKISIWGPTWNKSKNPLLRPYIIEKHLFGQDLAQVINRSRISLNIIDTTNYPAANMRFFETPIAHACQLSTSCPEWEDEYVDMSHIAYYHSDKDLFDKIDLLLTNETLNQEIRSAAYSLTKTHHTYLNRAQSIIDLYL